MHIIKLITADKTLLKWKTLPTKVRAIAAELNQIEGSDFQLDIEYRDVKPDVIDGHITPQWMDVLRQTVPPSVQFVAFHMSQKQSADWGIEAGLRGAHQRDKDKIAEFYLWSDEKTRRGRYSQFIQTFLHEFRHAFIYGTKRTDDTHDLHADGDIRGSFAGLKMSEYNPSREEQLSIIASLTAKLSSLLAARPQTLIHPIQLSPRVVTQPYGVKNAIYKLTGRHIGTDYRAPEGTPLHAPYNGSVTTAGKHPVLGFYLHYEYTYQGQKYEEQWCHLQSLPETGAYRRGAVVAFSGKTGMVTAEHFHQACWYNDVRTDLINQSNWNKLTLDPESLYANN